MTDLTALLQQGHSHVWLFIPSAILLGALHGLEPGHSKTMMAAFIVAVRGTWQQAMLLGLCATLSHTAVVWAVALVGLTLGRSWSDHAIESYFQVASSAIIVAVALWMLWRTWHQQHACLHNHDHDHDHDHPPERVDAHAAAHAQAIQRRFAQREVTTGQIMAFGLTGGLIPCPASIAVLLLCLQLQQLALGATLVLGFSVGLALTLVLSGVVAALGARHLAQRWSVLGRIADRAPYVSGVLILLVGAYVGWQGWLALPTP